MSKGTKQIRLGRIMRLIDDLENRKKSMELIYESSKKEYPDIKNVINERITELNFIIKKIKEDFELESI